MSRFLTILGLIVTAVYTFVVYGVVADKLALLSSLSLNELGDFLAGVFGPVALLWLILGYLQQGIELKLNTKALETQVQELKTSVSQQKDLIDVARQQYQVDLELLKHERETADLSAQPNFVPDAVRGTHDRDGIRMFMWPIKNLGASVTNASLGFNVPMLSFQPSRIPEWREEQVVNLVFKFPKSGVTDTELSIVYTDAHGRPRTRILALKSDLSGEYANLHVLPRGGARLAGN